VFSVPLSVLSLLRAGSKLFFFALHPFDKSYCLFNALRFFGVFFDCFEYCLKFLIRHSFVNLLIQVFSPPFCQDFSLLTSLLYTYLGILSSVFQRIARKKRPLSGSPCIELMRLVVLVSFFVVGFARLEKAGQESSARRRADGFRRNNELAQLQAHPYDRRARRDAYGARRGGSRDKKNGGTRRGRRNLAVCLAETPSKNRIRRVFASLEFEKQRGDKRCKFRRFPLRLPFDIHAEQFARDFGNVETQSFERIS